MLRTDAHRGCSGLRPRNPAGYLYLMQMPGESLFKIGVSRCPLKRVQHLRRRGWGSVQLVHSFYFADAYEQESAWHRYFAARRRTLAGATEGHTECFELGDLSALYFQLYNLIFQMPRTDARRGSSGSQHNMNKKEVAEALNVSTRLVERYASENRLGEVTYVRGKTGKQAQYNREAVERLKAELESVDSLLPANSPETGIIAPRGAQSEQVLRVTALLTSIDDRLATQADNFADFRPGHPFFDLVQKLIEQASDVPIADLSHKLMLSLPEAARLSGVPVEALRAAVKAGKLKIVESTGRGFGKVKRPDLETYIRKL